MPTADLGAAPRLVRPRELGVEYALEHALGHGPRGGDGFYVTTNLGASEFHVLWAPEDDPSTWVPLMEEDPAVRVWGVDAFADGVVLSLRRDGAATLRVVPRDGAPFDLLPEHAGGMVRLGRNEDWRAPFVTVELESFLHPTVTVDVAWDGARTERHRKESLGVDLAAYVCEREWATAPDGTRVPVVLVRHRDTPLDGTAPCVLYGYGSYEAPCDPDWGIDWWRSRPVAARPRRGVRRRAPARRRRDGPSLVGPGASRGEAQHVRRPGRRRRAPARRPGPRRRHPRPLRRRAPAGRALRPPSRRCGRA